MGVCWYCYWGWPKPVADIYLKAVDKLDGDDSPLKFGPSHIVWEDENFEDHNIKYCLNHVDDSDRERFTEYDLLIVRKSLLELLALPEAIRCVEPENYDDEHPSLYPPADGTVMVKI